MSLIFFGSSDSRSLEHSSRFIEPFLHWLFPTMSQPHIAAIHIFFRNCGPLIKYAVFSLLFGRAGQKPVKNAPRPWRWSEAGIAIAIVFLYAATDEFHQRFV